MTLAESVYAERLPALLGERGIKQSNIARELRVDESTVSLWVSQKRPIPRRYLPGLVLALDVPIDELGVVDAQRPEADQVPQEGERMPTESGADTRASADDVSAPPTEPKSTQPRHRAPLQFSVSDGLPMLPPHQPVSVCSCGQLVRGERKSHG